MCMFKKIFILSICLFAFSANAIEKKTTFDQKLFNKAQSEGKIIVISSWIEYCSSCAKQMKILQTAKKKVNYQILNLIILSIFRLT